ncbi:MAG TPA: AAA family ATPase, partial [Anaerolineaceae bacterium]
MPNLQIGLLGTPFILRDGVSCTAQLSKKELALLAYLSAGPRRSYRREELAGLFWGEKDEDRANYNFRRAIWSIRSVINPPKSAHDIFIRFEDDFYSFCSSDLIMMDVTEFEKGVQGLRLILADQPSEAVRRQPLQKNQALAGVLNPYRGDFLATVHLKDCPVFEDWMYQERDRLRLLYLNALRLLVYSSIKSQEFSLAIEYCQAILKVDPTDEIAYREMMRAYNVTGKVETAIQQYHSLVKILKSELDLEPLSETRLLYESIRRGALPVDRTPYGLYIPSVGFSNWTRTASDLPFIGREGEQQTLREAIEAANLGKGRVIAVLGEAGVGKTRLVDTFLRGVPENTAILHARCYTQEDNLPYQPVIDALRGSLLQVAPANLRQLDDLWIAEIAKLLPEMQHYLVKVPFSPSLSPNQERSRLFEGVAQYLAHFKPDATLILFLDDLDFADVQTLKMIHYLGRRLADCRWILVFTLRSWSVIEDSSLREFLWSLKQAGLLTEIPLDRLSQAETATLVQAILPEEPELPRLVPRLYEESRGNPFFLIERLHMLRENREWQNDQVPSGVLELIRNRLNKLDKLSRRVLNIAAAFGGKFSSSTLMRVYPNQDEAILETISRLSDRCWIEGLPGPEAGWYDFSHVLVRETIYKLLTVDQRRYLHKKVGLELEENSQVEGEQAGKLAYHFWEAHDLKRAQHYAMLAADSARHLFANQESRRYYLRVLEIERDFGLMLPASQHFQVVLNLGEVYQLLGEYEAAVQIYRQELPEADFKIGLSQSLLANPHIRQVSLELALAYNRQGSYSQAMAILHQLENAFTQIDDPALLIERAKITWGTARVFLNREQSHQALALCNHIQALLDQLDESQAVGEIRIKTFEIEASSNFNLGNYPAARQYFEHALKTARRIDLPVIIPRLLSGLSAVARRLGDYDEAEAYAREGLALCLKIGLLDGTAAAYATLGNVAYNRGRLEESRSNHEQALVIFRQLGDLHGIADQVLSVAFVLFEEGEVDEAEIRIQEAYQIGETIDAEMVMTRAHYHLAKVARYRGDLESARLHVEKAIEIANQAGIQMMKALGLRLLGEILARQQPIQA